MTEVDGARLDDIRSGFVPERLRMARELVGMSQGSLSREIVTPAAISQYERGSSVPSKKVLKQLADRLKVDPRFFTVQDTGFDAPAFFRSLRSAPAMERRRARHNTQLVHHIALEIEGEVRLPALDIPKYPVSERSDPQESAVAAEHVRREWGLPPGPIDHVVRCVERHGIVVARLASGHEKIDSFSVPFPDRPVIMMSAAKGKKDRSRLDVAHELGHLVMHEAGQRATRMAEKQAHQFAAAFLMPEREIRGELPQWPDWRYLMDLKRKWQTSIASLLYRARTLGVMDEEVYTQAMKVMSARGWRRHEPGDLGEPESPVLLNRAVDTAQLSEADLIARTAMSASLLRDILNLATDNRPEVVI